MAKQKYKSAKNWSCSGKYWKKSFNGFDVWERKVTETKDGEKLPTVSDFIITRCDMIPNPIHNTKYENHTVIENFITLDEALLKAEVLEVKNA